MAKKTVCDKPVKGGGICGADASEITVIKDGKAKVLELCDAHAKPITDILTLGVPTQVAKPNSKKKRGGPSDAEVRAWARDKGIEVGSMGRIPNAVKEQYLAAR